MFKDNPLSLIVVAFIFLLIGVRTCIGIFEALYNKPDINEFVYYCLNHIPEMLGILVFWGLLKHIRAWRIVALIFIWVEMLWPLFAGIWLFTKEEPISIFGISSQMMSFPLFLITLVAIFLLALWQYTVLTNVKIKKLFSVEKEEGI